jgi:ABC-type Mn2+/Zn2+ transport system ATPase subunit
MRLGPQTPREGAKLDVVGLSVFYGNETAVRDVSFSVEPGEVVALIGPNGAGKSSLLNAISGHVPHSGSVVVKEQHCHHRRDRANLAIIPQRSEIDPDFPITVAELVATGRRRFLRLGRRLASADWLAVQDALGTVGLADLATRPIRTLSGGQLQRAFLARALAQEADILLLDEALSGVDQPSVEALVTLFGKLANAGTSVLVATHDLSLVRRRFARCLPINRRLLADGPPSTVLDTALLDSLFGSAELDCSIA